MSKEGEKFITSDYIPCSKATLAWVFIDAPGKPAMDPTKPFRKVVTLYADKKDAQPLLAKISEFWEANKGKGWTPKSLGSTVEKKLKEGGNPDDEKDYVETGRIGFNFWTGAVWPEKDKNGKQSANAGKDRVVDIFNAKGGKTSLGGKKIGNGSKGAVSATMDIYENGTGPKANRGVTLYLNAIQLTSFVEFTQDAGFKSQEAEEDAFMGVEETFEGTAADGASTAQAKPRL